MDKAPGFLGAFLLGRGGEADKLIVKAIGPIAKLNAQWKLTPLP